MLRICGSSENQLMTSEGTQPYNKHTLKFIAKINNFGRFILPYGIYVTVLYIQAIVPPDDA